MSVRVMGGGGLGLHCLGGASSSHHCYHQQRHSWATFVVV
jgi:hypothetical protein